MATLRIEQLQKCLDKFGKKHFFVDTGSEDVDYVAVDGYYVLEVPKDSLRLPNYEDGYHFERISGMERRITQIAEAGHDFEFKEVKTLTSGTTVCVFTDGVEEIYIDRRFFKDFYNGLFSTKGFAKNVTFTGTNKNEMLVAWQDNDLIGAYCPIRHL